MQFAAVFQDDPSGILVHADSPVRTFADLQGKTIIARPEWTFLKFLQKKYALTLNVVPQNFSVAAFLGNKEALQQGYFIAIIRWRRFPTSDVRSILKSIPTRRFLMPFTIRIGALGNSWSGLDTSRGSITRCLYLLLITRAVWIANCAIASISRWWSMRRKYLRRRSIRESHRKSTYSIQ